MVTIRYKSISKGRKRIYLDFYPPIPHPQTGKTTRREFLELYLFDKPLTPADREHNKETKILSENIRAKRQIEIQNGQYGFIDRAKKNLDFVAYFRELAEKRKTSKGNYDNWLSCYNYLKAFTNGNLMISSLTERFCIDFRDYLQTTNKLNQKTDRLSQNAAHSYFNKFKAAVSEAVKDKILAENPLEDVESIKQAETKREYLTQEELERLAATECKPTLLKKASLFSVLTGLRWSDLTALTWAQIQHSEAEGYFIRFKQQKTKAEETMPISDTAFRLLGERKSALEKPFGDLIYSAWLNTKLNLWVMKAGITKEITFHCFRHTYATLQLSNGTDIYTVSKMLGHKDLKTTAIYTKIIDEKKREAANRINVKIEII